MPSQRDAIEAAVNRLAERLSTPSDAYPTVRCLSRPALIALLNEIRRELRLSASQVRSGSDLLGHLERSRLATVVPLDATAKGIRSDRLYAVGLGADPHSLDPIELLQAHVPDGVVCYFTALGVHDLTTQPIAFHHVATVTTTASRQSKAPSQSPSPSEEAWKLIGHAQPPIGQWQFTFEAVPYYLTVRSLEYLAGVQVRYLHDRSRYRVTTLEQTLLDTMHRPHSCGGPAVVFEAWQSAADRLNFAKLANLAQRTEDSRLIRRVGYMLSQIGIAGPAEQNVLLEAAQAAEGSEPFAPPVPLIAGMPYHTVDQTWKLFVP